MVLRLDDGNSFTIKQYQQQTTNRRRRFQFEEVFLLYLFITVSCQLSIQEYSGEPKAMYSLTFSWFSADFSSNMMRNSKRMLTFAVENKRTHNI